MSLDAQSITRICGIIVLVFTVFYLLLAILPFYANGIHLHSYQEINRSLVDVKDYPPFTWLGGPAQGVAMLTAGYIPVVSLILIPPLLFTLALSWSSFRGGEAALWLATAVTNVVALALTWPVLVTVVTWLVD